MPSGRLAAAFNQSVDTRIMHATAEKSNGEADGYVPGTTELRGYIEAYLSQGLNRNEVMLKVTRVSPHLAGEAIRILTELANGTAAHQGGQKSNKPPSRGGDVNQENQENQDLPAKSTENEREPAIGLAAGGAEQKHQDTNQQRWNEGWAVFQRDLRAGYGATLPFADYVAYAVTESRHDACRRDGWQSPLFYFVRLVKAHPDMAKATGKSALVKVEKLMRAWPDPKGQRDGRWRYWFDVSGEDAQAEFLDAWEKARFLPGHSPLASAFEMAKRLPLSLKEETKAGRSDGYERFVSIAGWLQVGMGDRNILLPVEQVAEWLGVQPMTISRYRKWAKDDDFLREVVPYDFRGKGKGGKATEFRFDVSRFRILTETAERGTAESFASPN